MKEFTILGERCSGTKFLERLLLDNFDISVTWKYDWKHWFGFENYENNSDILFLGIVRDPVDWINSIKNKPHHVHPSLLKDKESFLNNEWWSTEKNHGVGNEVMKDRNMITNKRYKNIFELRKTKLLYLLDVMPKNVVNYSFINYEDLIKNHEDVMEKLRLKYNLIKKHEKYVTRTNEHQSYKPTYSVDEIKNHKDYDKESEYRAGYI